MAQTAEARDGVSLHLAHECAALWLALRERLAAAGGLR
jgi:hypothetical protein